MSMTVARRMVGYSASIVTKVDRQTGWWSASFVGFGGGDGSGGNSVAELTSADEGSHAEEVVGWTQAALS